MTLDMNDKRSVDVGNVWWFWFTTNAFAVDKRLRHILRVLPRIRAANFVMRPFRALGVLLFGYYLANGALT